MVIHQAIPYFFIIYLQVLLLYLYFVIHKVLIFISSFRFWKSLSSEQCVTLLLKQRHIVKYLVFYCHKCLSHRNQPVSTNWTCILGYASWREILIIGDEIWTIIQWIWANNTASSHHWINQSISVYLL